MRNTLLASALSLSLLAGCTAGTDRFVGPVSGCGTNTLGVLDIRGTGFIFTPDQGVLEIHGTVGANGQLQGTASEGTPNTRDRYVLSFDGTRAKDTITGQLSRADCKMNVTLRER